MVALLEDWDTEAKQRRLDQSKEHACFACCRRDSLKVRWRGTCRRPGELDNGGIGCCSCCCSCCCRCCSCFRCVGAIVIVVMVVVLVAADEVIFVIAIGIGVVVVIPVTFDVSDIICIVVALVAVVDVIVVDVIAVLDVVVAVIGVVAALVVVTTNFRPVLSAGDYRFWDGYSHNRRSLHAGFNQLLVHHGPECFNFCRDGIFGNLGVKFLWNEDFVDNMQLDGV
mmetsp:Transcript_34428/g.63028  ORF Transcript_34428/g.63028 Transcript_34428/m.63028 type:complete len:225 (+) Transcript_34428:151-825(+)